MVFGWCNQNLEKYDFVNGKDDIPYIVENKSLKPPTSNTSEAEDLFGVYHCNAVGLNPCDYCQNGNLLM